MSGAADANAAFTRGALGGCQGLCAAAAAYTTEDRAKTKKRQLSESLSNAAGTQTPSMLLGYTAYTCLLVGADVFSALNPQLKIINLVYIL